MYDDSQLSRSARLGNIGAREQSKRRRLGVVMLAIAALLAAALIFNGAAWWARLVVFAPAMSGFLGVFQAQEKT